MEVFRALVEAQDGELSVAQSRQMVSRRFDLSEKEVRTIEREGAGQVVAAPVSLVAVYLPRPTWHS